MPYISEGNQFRILLEKINIETHNKKFAFIFSYFTKIGRSCPSLFYLNLYYTVCLNSYYVIRLEYFLMSWLNNAMVNLKHLVGGNVVGSGSDFIVVQKAKRRFLIEIKIFKIQELKNATTPYGSQF
jgi:hypothetical protein